MRFASLVAVLALAGCATVTAEPDQDITVDTTPPGASCSLKNNEGTWTIPLTPGTVKVKRSFSTLSVFCGHPDFGNGDTSIPAQTRARSWGNLLMFGLPATVDAATGDGYEYTPSTVIIPLK